jgi:serine/threonine protein kinase
MPDLLDHGDNWILIPYYEDIVRHEPNTRSLLPLRFAKQILETVQQVHAAGYFCGDFSPGNIIIDRREGPKFIDLEFLYPYPGDPGPFEDSPSVQGMPYAFPAEIPEGSKKTYSRLWEPLIGLSLYSLLYDPVPLQHLKRLEYRAKTFMADIVRALAGTATRVLGRLRQWGPGAVRAEPAATCEVRASHTL